MKISEIKGERALDVLSELIEPVAEIMADNEIKEAYESKNAAKAISVAIKRHKKAIITVMAAVDGVPADNYEVNLFTLPFKLLELLNDPAIAEFFTSQGQMGDAKSSGSVLENTKEN